MGRQTRSGPRDDRCRGAYRGRDRRRWAGRRRARGPARERRPGGGRLRALASLALARGRAGLAPAVLAEVARPIPAMRVEPPGGAAFRLTYGTETGGPPAVGFD